MRKKKITLYLLLSMVSLLFLINNNITNPRLNSIDSNNQKDLYLSAQSQWLENIDFSTQQEWFSVKGDQGDNSSVNADITSGMGNLHILGEKQIYQLYGVPNSTDSPNWIEYAKPEYYLPDTTNIDSYGCYVSHSWNERSNQFPGVHWRKNITMPVDMSKYEIISANLDVIYNASVVGLGDNAVGGVDVLGESAVNQFGIGDFVSFYVLISDINFANPYIVAFNRTIDLGLDSDGATSIIGDKLISTYGENVLITALNSAFEKDPSHSNFTITLGIDIYCEDNWGDDRDTFNYLRIKECNLTFTYERKIEKFTSIAWNQIGDAVDGENVQITNAICYFNYSISEAWPYDLSPFSELRILINDNAHRETIQLSTMTTNMKYATFEGEDFTSLFREEVNITISIQIYVANTFGLNRTISISIDNVYLYISYIFISLGADYSILVIGLTAGIIGIVIAFSLYQFHFKYPPLVRKIRKLKRNVGKGKIKKPILVNNREDIIQDNLNEKKNILEFESLNIEQIKINEKISIHKEGKV
ncbi:MAG: hypothetical protein ACFFE5_11580 [Candidatus Thorarchaeota archaeon]